MTITLPEAYTKLPPQTQAPPGSQKQMRPQPIEEDKNYVGSGKLNGKVAIITGADSGIGRSAAILFAKEGADICIVYLDEHEDAEKTLARIKELGHRVIRFSGDLAEPDFCEEVVQRTINAFGHIDILVNNAGEQGEVGGVEDLEPEHVEKIFRTNIFGFFYLTKATLPHLKEGAAIINTTSILSYVPSVIEATYSASKVALRFYTETLRKHLELSKSNVKVFELLPPVVATEMTAARSDKKITPEKLVKTLIASLQKDQFTIRVGDTKLIYIINRLFPKIAFGLVNSKENIRQLMLQDFTR